MENHCLQGGEYYASTLCGPRGTATCFERRGVARSTPDTASTSSATCRARWPARALAEDGGGEGASDEATTAAHLAKSWFERDILLGEDQAAAFVRGICRTMRSLNEDEDTGPEFAHRFRGGSLGYIVSETVYTMCKESKLPTCVMEPAKQIIDGVFELGMCVKDQPTCLRDREQCLGQCSGNATAGLLSQDFITSFSKQELGTLTDARLAAGRVTQQSEARFCTSHVSDFRFVHRVHG